MIASGNLVLDANSRTMQHASSGATVPITRQQVAALECLLSRPDRTVSSEGLARVIWAERGRPPSWIQAIRVQIHNLRAAADSIELHGVIRTMGQAGWRVDGGPSVVRVYTPEQAVIADAALAAHHSHESTPV